MERLAAWMLRLFPVHFRTEFGETVLTTLAERSRDARRRGWPFRLRFVLREAAGLALAALRERHEERQEARRAARTRGPGGIGGRPDRLPAPQAVRSALRQFRRHPLYAFASALTLALAVGTGSASLAVVKRAFLDPLPYQDDTRLVALYTVAETWAQSPVSIHVMEDMRAAGAPFEGFAPMDPEGVVLTTEAGTRQVTGLFVTPEYFATLGVRPAQGGVWGEGELHAAVVSWTFAQETLGGAAEALGRSIRLNGVDHVIVGIMAPDFYSPWFTDASVWLPLDAGATLARLPRGVRSLSLVARIAPGASLTQVETFLAGFSSRLQQDHPDVHGRQSWAAEPLRATLVGETRTALLAVGAAALLLVLIVGANIAGLSAARAVTLQRQMAVRVALGATARRLAGERILDGLAISVLGTAAGLSLAYGLTRAVASAQASFLPRVGPIALDPSIVGVGALLGLVVGMAAIVLPQSRTASEGAAAKLTSRGSTGGTAVTVVRSGLVVAQVALSVVLIVGAGLLVRTVHALASTELGYVTEGVVSIPVGLPGERYASADAQIAWEGQALERLRRVPGVREITASVGVPIIGGTRAAFTIDGVTFPDGPGEVAYFSVAPGFFEALGIPVSEGRGFTAEDRGDAPPVMVINETLARRHWPNGGAVGAWIRVGNGDPATPPQRIVGVVPDIHQHGPTSPILPTVYGSTHQYSWARRNVTARVTGDMGAAVEGIRLALAELDPNAPIGRISTFRELIDERTARQRLALGTLGLYGVVATLLTAFGLFAVVSLASRMRRREYAIRVAVGAGREGVRWLVLRQALALGVAGTLLGLGTAALATRTLAGLLHGVRPLDAGSFIGAGGLVLALAVLAAWFPARAACRVDPVEALQAE